jgi:hypothetical protein
VKTEIGATRPAPLFTGVPYSGQCNQLHPRNRLRICTGPYRSEHRSCYSPGGDGVSRDRRPAPSHGGWFLAFRAKSSPGRYHNTTRYCQAHRRHASVLVPTRPLFGPVAACAAGGDSIVRATAVLYRWTKPVSATQRPRSISSNILRSRSLSTVPSRHSDSPEVSRTRDLFGIAASVLRGLLLAGPQQYRQPVAQAVASTPFEFALAAMNSAGVSAILVEPNRRL